jgi:FtsH ternary system domain X7
MAPRFRRRDPRPPTPSGPPRPPGPGSVSPLPPGPAPVDPEELQAAPPPDSAPPAPREPEVADVLARFGTAARALSFAEQVMQSVQLDGVRCYRGDAGRSWWIQARLTLGSAREMAGLGAAELYVGSGNDYVRDRGWGESAGGEPAEIPELADASLLDLVRVAGLHPASPRPLPDAYVLLPGYLVPGLLERALDLRLQVTYQQVRLEPLFDPDAAARFCYAVRVSAAARATLPETLLAALRDDPFALVCRSLEQALLIGYGTASPLSDRALAQLVAVAGDETWLLAGPPDGCARVTWIDQPLDAANFVQLAAAHELADLDGSQPYAQSLAQRTSAQPRALTLVPVTTRHSVSVDAVLLDDADLECLPLLLAGDPLADIAFLVRGARQHLLSAPGGLLTELGVGRPLTCVGPGSLYLPIGYRLDPPVGPSARAALFAPESSNAQVLLPDSRLGYRLDTAVPVWSLWAGPVPALDLQLPRSAAADLEQVAEDVGEPPRPRAADWPSIRSALRRPATPPPADPSEWRRQAQRAELDQDYVAAAQLYARHNEPLRAARMWERDAEERP